MVQLFKIQIYNQFIMSSTVYSFSNKRDLNVLHKKLLHLTIEPTQHIDYKPFILSN